MFPSARFLKQARSMPSTLEDMRCEESEIDPDLYLFYDYQRPTGSFALFAGQVLADTGILLSCPARRRPSYSRAFGMPARCTRLPCRVSSALDRRRFTNDSFDDVEHASRRGEEQGSSSKRRFCLLDFHMLQPVCTPDSATVPRLDPEIITAIIMCLVLSTRRPSVAFALPSISRIF